MPIHLSSEQVLCRQFKMYVCMCSEKNRLCSLRNGVQIHKYLLLGWFVRSNQKRPSERYFQLGSPINGEWNNGGSQPNICLV